MSWSKSCTTFLLVLLALLSACSREAPPLNGAIERPSAWSEEFVAEFGATPVQNEGRVQPLSTFAAFTLYAVHGRRDVQFRTDSGTTKLNPTEWLLDVWCYPRQAANYPLFRIENVAVLEALGLHHEGQGQRFEYLSVAQMFEKAEKLEQLAARVDGKRENERTAVEKHIAQLYHQLIVTDRLFSMVAPVQYEVAVQGELLKGVFGALEKVGLAEVLQRAGAFAEMARGLDPKAIPEGSGNLTQVLSFVEQAARARSGPKWFPPLKPAGQVDTWHDLAEIVGGAFQGTRPVDGPHLAMIGHLQAGLVAQDLLHKQQGLLAFGKAVAAAAGQRDEVGTVRLESYYYAANWHFHSMMTFVLGFLLACIAWVVPNNRMLWWASMAASGLGIVLLTIDVWLRCLITGHPPITRLYDTFLFIGGVCAVVLVIAEWILPRRIALALAPFLGAMLIFFARLFEVADGQDTMKPLQAVLLSNFWLGIHVPTMNIGYASGLAGAVVAVSWVVVRALRFDDAQASLTKVLAKVTYGVTCFSLATSVVGTILGGVWANDSWGRFWGWDPKENGALLICLSQIALLHARMSGMVRDPGFVLWSIFTGMIVVFSWFHTNLLGVGLHAYGFSSALHTGVWISYALLGGFLLLGALDVWLRPNPAPRTESLPDALGASR